MYLNLPVILTIIFATSCSTNYHAQFYKENVSIKDIKEPETINRDPVIFRTDDFMKAYNQALSEGYILLGISVFEGSIDKDYNILQLARDKGATLVIKTSKFSRTEYSNIYLPLTSTSTSQSYANGYARSNIYNNSNSYVGSAYTTARASSTTTTQNTDWVPFQISEHIYQQATALFIKSKIKYSLGAYYRELSIEEKKEFGTNKGVYITNVIKRTPAYDMDLVPGDIITEINNIKINDVEDLNNYLRKGEKINNLKVNRRNSTLSLFHEDRSRNLSSDTEVQILKTDP